MRFVGERKACAAIVLSFFGSLFLLNGLAGPPPLAPMFLALAAVYLAGFFGVVAGWFWARWYALGLASSGLLTAAVLGFQLGLEPVVLIWGGAHAGIGLALLGRGPASAFDARKDWRARLRMDDGAADRLGKAIMRAAASLPYLIMAGLAPRQGSALALLALVAGAAGIAGFVGLLRLRTWGLLALAVSSAALLVGAGLGVGGGGAGTGVEGVLTAPLAGRGAGVPLALAVPAAGLLLLAAVAPFARPIVLALSGRR